jgi:hypothetical protein
MEDSGVTKVIAVRLEHSGGKPIPVPESVEALEEEEVEFEEGSELPPVPAAQGAAARGAVLGQGRG